MTQASVTISPSKAGRANPMQPELTAVTIAPTAKHLYSVIWLHGLGADGHDFEGIVPSLSLKAQANTHFIFPNAPIQPVTINNKMRMRAWYDILALSPDEAKVDIAGIYRSSELVTQFLKQETDKGINPKHILLAGFSQGGAIALHLGLRYSQPLAGIMALSTHLPTINQLSSEGSSAGKHTPIFMAHGILDAVIAIEAGKTAHERLKTLGYQIEWHDYLMEHTVSNEEIGHISTFMNKVLT